MKYQLQRFIGVTKFKAKRAIYRYRGVSDIPKLSGDLGPPIHLLSFKKKFKQQGLKTKESRLNYLKSITNHQYSHALIRAIQSYENQESVETFSWNDFKLISELSDLLEDHKRYEDCLTQYDSVLELMTSLNATKSKFIGYGLGEQTLNTYRYIEFQGVVYFEKIYLTQSDDLRHLLWFFNYGQDSVIQAGYRLPEILKVSKGDKLTAVYFEFIDNKLDNLNDFINNAFKIAFTLKNINLSSVALEESQKFKFQETPLYRDNYTRLQSILFQQGVKDNKLAEMQNKINTMTGVLSHGDLHGKNLGNPNVIIDWDKSGVYPQGFDIAYILSNCYIFIGMEDLLFFLKRQISSNQLNTHNSEEYNELLFSILFFAMIFYSRKIGNKILPEGILSMYQYLLEQFYQLCKIPRYCESQLIIKGSSCDIT